MSAGGESEKAATMIMFLLSIAHRPIYVEHFMNYTRSDKRRKQQKEEQ